MMSIYSVEKEGYLCLVTTLDSMYELPMCKYLSQRTIPCLYSGIYLRCREVLSKNRMWSSRTMQPYMSYKVDFIDKECLRDRCLKTMFLPKDYTADNIMEALGIFLLRISPA